MLRRGWRTAQPLFWNVSRGHYPSSHQQRWASRPAATSPSTTEGSPAPLPKDREADEAGSIAAALEADPRLMEAMVAKLKPDQRRALIVAGGAFEWFGKDNVRSEVKAADFDNDRVISPRDFTHWFENALKRHSEAEAATSTECKPVPLAALMLIALETGLPFVGFGFLDNATMILAGDAIDRTVGLYFHCSVMACAALGNVVSGILGMQVHGGVEKLVHALGLPVPILTLQQRRSQRVFFAGHIGGTVGIAVGLTLGMLPLLWLRDEEKDRLECSVFLQFARDERLPLDHVDEALKCCGVTATPERRKAAIASVAAGPNGIALSEFLQLCERLRDATVK